MNQPTDTKGPASKMPMRRGYKAGEVWVPYAKVEKDGTLVIIARNGSGYRHEWTLKEWAELETVEPNT